MARKPRPTVAAPTHNPYSTLPRDVLIRLLTDALTAPVAPVQPTPETAPVATAPEPKRRGRPPKVRIAPDWRKEIHTCPNCGRSGPVDPMFGVRLHRGLVHKQSYCVECRKTLNYHKLPRRYTVDR